MSSNSLCKHLAEAAGVIIGSILSLLHKNQTVINVKSATFCSVTPNPTWSDPIQAKRYFRGSEGECPWDSYVRGIAGMRTVCLHTQRLTAGATRRGRPSQGQHKRTSRGGPAPGPRNGLATSTTLTVISKRVVRGREDAERARIYPPTSKRRKMTRNARPRTDRKDNGAHGNTV